MDTKRLESSEEKEAFRQREVDVQWMSRGGGVKGQRRVIRGRTFVNRNIVNL